MLTDPERDPWPSVEDRPAQDHCKFCEALPTESHGLDCPLFLPICACGAAAGLHDENGKPICKKCQRRSNAEERNEQPRP